MVNTRIPPAITSLELSRSAERIIAAAPALQAAPDRKRRDEVKAELEAEVGTLKTKLLELQRDRSEVSPLARIEPIVTSLTTNLGTLEERVAGRLDTNDRIKSLMRFVFQTNDATQRLLAPWLMIMEGQISKLVDAAQRSAPTGNADGDSARRLAALVEQQRPAQSAERQFSAAVDMLAEASTADQDRRLRVLAFQLGRALRDLEGTALALDPKLRPLFLEQVAKLREFVEGPNAITEARKQELALIAEGEKRLAENAVFKAQLTAAVDELAVLASGDIRDATRDAVSVQQFSTRVLIAAVVLSLLSSALIVWLYVSRNIVRRLTALSSGMLAIAGGRLEAGPAPKGKDEIAAMGRAVEVFRRNAIELQQLLEERMKAAERLEEIVEDRTRELQESLRIPNRYKRRAERHQPLAEPASTCARRHCGNCRPALRSVRRESLVETRRAAQECSPSRTDPRRLRQPGRLGAAGPQGAPSLIEPQFMWTILPRPTSSRTERPWRFGSAIGPLYRRHSCERTKPLACCGAPDRGTALLRETNRTPPDLRRPGRDRDRERAPV